ncbi:hypothetical protein COCC4DRAFT_166815 [Bipolaris maydis ATCC 48331]|uniref:Uncharacterized protein n=2 Tax=Cochliobolus heterostrophus TaxID=5016 RepID=M2UEM7_COCH5|nr:uncharacterized protein COCC4DRAFT_166815 [Bipolaris maydis ATCC 48331]EMD86443.1 hypothetical protein COCHEDRAFT_1198351 [Bipolaris maydis C5]KAH7551861.1 hypothetical protein BM1_09495 [Bipolaris maydis]ENI06394.1 hypothetical protein COCC4DRAFT_166815 [Bipolaris maydis ATCC 48331]KAJ5029901.1 hypothetical protein J3E73DRAFT_253041 [Bipolaris maydis]KAJ5064904.1 hypothetical protein J3E74DRAFT_285398 [Bipolaris maydis]
MHAFTLLIATMGLASASPISNFLSSRSSAPRDIVASVDRYAGASCTGKICNIAGSGDLVSGCNAVTDDCVASLRLNYANNGCSVKVFADDNCKQEAGSVGLQTAGVCSALAGSETFKSIYVTC